MLSLGCNLPGLQKFDPPLPTNKISILYILYNETPTRWLNLTRGNPFTLSLMVSTLSFSMGTTPLGGSPFSSCITDFAYFMVVLFICSGSRVSNGTCSKKKKHLLILHEIYSKNSIQKILSVISLLRFQIFFFVFFKCEPITCICNDYILNACL